MSKKQKSDTGQRQFWEMVFETFENSDLSIRKFCKKEGLSEWAFYNWRRKLNKSQKDNSTKAISDKSDKPSFVEVSLPDNKPAVVELVLRSDNTLKINSRSFKMTQPKQKTEKPLLLNANQTAEMLNLSRTAFYNLRITGRFPLQPVRINSKILFKRADVEKWVSAGCPPENEWK
jgi:predicted DNA-binding transcriptional regulator AlpA